MPKAKTEETGSLSKYELAKLKKLYSQGKASYGSIKSLQKASGYSEKKVKSFLQSKNAYTKFRQATRKFTRLPAFAKYINEIWCLDVAYMDKLARFNNGIKYLLVGIDIFSRFVRVQPMKSKNASDTVTAFQKMITKKNRPTKLWTDMGTEFAGPFKEFCRRNDITMYSTKSETKAAYAERAIRSLKNIIYRFMEDNGDKYVHKLSQFVATMNSRENRKTKLVPNKVKNTNFLHILYNRPIRNKKKPKFKLGDSVRISKQDIPFRKGYKSQFTNEIFKIIKVLSSNPPTYNIKGQDGDVILGKFYEQELTKVIIS